MTISLFLAAGLFGRTEAEKLAGILGGNWFEIPDDDKLSAKQKQRMSPQTNDPYRDYKIGNRTVPYCVVTYGVLSRHHVWSATLDLLRSGNLVDRDVLLVYPDFPQPGGYLHEYMGMVHAAERYLPSGAGFTLHYNSFQRTAEDVARFILGGYGFPADQAGAVH